MAILSPIMGMNPVTYALGVHSIDQLGLDRCGDSYGLARLRSGFSSGRPGRDSMQSASWPRNSL